MALPLLLPFLHFLQQISVALVIANSYKVIGCVKMEGKNHSIIGGIGNWLPFYLSFINGGIQSVSKLFLLQFRITSRSV